MEGELEHHVGFLWETLIISKETLTHLMSLIFSIPFLNTRKPLRFSDVFREHIKRSAECNVSTKWNLITQCREAVDNLMTQANNGAFASLNALIRYSTVSHETKNNVVTHSYS